MSINYLDVMKDLESGTDITLILQEAILNNHEVEIPKGKFFISNTILLGDNCSISGSGNRETTLILADAVNKNMFTNNDHLKGNKNISLENLTIDGNFEHQYKPETEKRISFCNIVYMARSMNCRFINLNINNVLQTALHFNNCDTINIKNLNSQCLGWSGISTSGTNNIFAIDFFIYDSGKDHRHSAIHLDGGSGSFLKGTIKKCVGNGVMLDSTFSDFSNSVVQVDVSECMRGISLIGSDISQPRSISINKTFCYDNEIGIMVSNSRAAFIEGAHIEKSKEVGLLFQGRVGGTDSFVSNCTFINNKEDIKEIHQSKNNYFISNTFINNKEVITGKNEILFLATSVHNILDHLTGRITIPEKSINNFEKNINSRELYCRKREINYRHIIFPDKISALQDYFPIKNLLTFSDRYKHTYTDKVMDLINHISNKPDYFLKTDTHLSFIGKVETSIKILQEFLPLEENEIRATLNGLKGEEYEYLGDLGSKITPTLIENHYRIKHDHVKKFNNMVGANDGLCHVYFNLNKIKSNSPRRLLVFADSFLERSLPLISYFYSEILFCRSRYFHSEIADMFQPDDIITASAERYFSAVRLDEEAPRFDLIYGTRNINYSTDTDFYKAYNAVTSYPKPMYKNFIERLINS